MERNVDFDTPVTKQELDAADKSDIVTLRTKWENCLYCGAKLESAHREKDTDVVIYSRSGSRMAKHKEMRCSDRKSCRKGHFYGYTVSDGKIVYDEDCLKNEYLLTSRQTAFQVEYLYENTLHVLFSASSFQSLANVYNAFHFATEETEKREEIWQERIADAFFLYSLIEISQRYGLPCNFDPKLTA